MAKSGGTVIKCGGDVTEPNVVNVEERSRRKKKKHEGIIIKMIHDDKCILNSSGGEEGEARTRMYAKTCRHENSTFQENIFSWRIKNTYVKCRR